MPGFLSRFTAAGVAACASLLLLPALLDAGVIWWQRVLVFCFLGGAAIAPRQAALALVAAVPLAFLGTAIGPTPFRVPEAIVVSCLAGWGLRGSVLPRARGGVPFSVAIPAVLAVGVVSASALVLMAGVSAADPVAFRESAVGVLRRDYFLDRGPLLAVTQPILQVESLALFAAALVLGRDERWIPSFARMLVAGATGAAAFNLLRLSELALRSESGWRSLAEAGRAIRINVSYGDVNAAGSYFALAAVVAIGTMLTMRRARAWTVAAATVIIVAAAWTTGSRAGVAAILVGTVALLLFRLRDPVHRKIASRGLLGCCVAAVLFVALFPNPIAGAGTSVGWVVRREMARISLAMLQQRPWFGVGVGTFYDTSAAFLPASPIGAYYARENAHNNVLQIVAEVGIIGAAVFAWLGSEAVRRYTRAVRSSANGARSVLVAGVAAFGATMLFGHPLLTAEVSYVFALAAGAAAATSLEQPRPSSAFEWRTVAAAMTVLVLIVTLPTRINAERAAANLDHVAWGVGPWQSDTGGERYRRMEGSATLFVPRDAALVELSYRQAHAGPAVKLLVSYRGHTAAELVVDRTEWTKYRMLIPRRASGARFEAVRLTVTSGDPTNVLLGKIIEF